MRAYSVLLVFYFFSCVWAVLQTVTVDDNDGRISYSPDIWNYGPTCPPSHCDAHPDASQAYQGSWHETTYDPANPILGIATFSFTGTSVTVYGITGHTQTFSSTDITFFIDNQQVGTFGQSPTNQDGFSYNVPLFTSPTLSNSPHTLKIQNGHNGGSAMSLIIIDRIIYSFDDGTSITTTNPPGNTNNGNPNGSISQPGSSPTSGSGSGSSSSSGSPGSSTSTGTGSSHSGSPTSTGTSGGGSNGSTSPSGSGGSSATDGGSFPTTGTANPSNTSGVGNNVAASSSDGKSHTSVIIGVVIGVLILIILLLLLLFFFIRRRRAQSESGSLTYPINQMDDVAPGGPPATWGATSHYAASEASLGHRSQTSNPYGGIAPSEAAWPAAGTQPDAPPSVPPRTGPPLFSRYRRGLPDTTVVPFDATAPEASEELLSNTTSTKSPKRVVLPTMNNSAYSESLADSHDTGSSSFASSAPAQRLSAKQGFPDTERQTQMIELEAAVLLAAENQRLRDENQRLREHQEVLTTVEEEQPPPYLQVR